MRVEKGIRKEGFPRVVPPQVKELENIKMNRCIVLLLEEEGKDLHQHLVPVGAFKQAKVKYLNAHTAIKAIWVFAYG